MPNPWEHPEYGERFREGPIPHNPLRPEQVEVLLHLAAAHAPRRLLDVGCGPGLLAAAFLERFPELEVVGCDFSERMLERAHARLGGCATLVRAAMDADWSGTIDGPFDMVVAVQSVHHLDRAGKRRAWANFFSVLRPGGLFLQSDPTDPSELFMDHYRALWNRARARAGFEPLPDDYDRAAFDEQLARQGDLLEPLPAQLAGLKECGFDPVDCFWHYGNRAIFGGLRPA